MGRLFPDSRDGMASSACPVEECDDVFDSKHGARIHFRYHTEDEKRSTLISVINQLNDDIGRPPTPDEMDDCGVFSVTTYQHYYGTWADALRAAGYEPQRDRSLTKEDLLPEIHSLYEELGHVPTAPDIVRFSKHSIRTFTTRFGSWNRALTEAGYEPTVVREIDLASLLAELQRLHDELGHVPSTTQMDELGKFSSATYWAYFDSWNRAIRLAGYEPRSSLRHSWNCYYGSNWRSRREEIIQRDNYACRICKINRNETPRDLHVHHIRPAHEFVSTESVDYDSMNQPSNLITLCSGCHRTYEGLWKDCSPDEFAQNGEKTT